MFAPGSKGLPMHRPPPGRHRPSGPQEGASHPPEVPGVAPLVSAMLVSRLPIGINGIAVLLFISGETGSFGIAGLVSGVMALGMAAGGPLQGRFVDHGGTRVLNLAACVYVAGMLGVWLVDADDSLALVLVAALTAGAALPNTTSVLRSGWPAILRDRPGAITAAPTPSTPSSSNCS